MAGFLNRHFLSFCRLFRSQQAFCSRNTLAHRQLIQLSNTICSVYGRNPALHPRFSNSQKTFGGLLLAFSLPFLKKDDDPDSVEEDPLITVLKRGILASQKRDYKKAQEFFHQGLEIGAKRHQEKTIDDRKFQLMQINIFSLMADTAMKSGDLENAEKLYKDTMQRCLSFGKDEYDESILEISIKLASIYAMQSRDDEAEIGFKYCVEATDRKVKEAGGLLEADTNTLALKGISYQSYARFQMKKKQFVEAIKLYTESLDIAKEVYGANHPQTLVVLNDLASAYVISRQYKEGIEYYKEAAERAEMMEDMDESLVAFYYNLGEANILAQDFTAAKENCSKCFQYAKKLGDQSLIERAKQCLKDVKEVKAKSENKS